jgi:hypothetical protein
MVEVFLKDILCWESEMPGLFGHTEAFYGTVEQQGRLTLHLHQLLWNAFSPQEIHDRIMGKDSVFQSKLIEYLESAHQGEFTHGTLYDVRERVKADPDVEDLQSGSPAYKAPTQILPEVPPPMCKGRCEEGSQGCVRLARWWQKYKHEVDDLLLRSSVHKCRHSVQDEQETESKKDWRHLKKKRKTEQKYYERRGCLNRHGVCKARFPRDIFAETSIDQDSHINFKKQEPNMNTFSRIITYCSAPRPT